MKSPKKCSVGLCKNQASGAGLCHTHYQRQRRTGSTDAPPAPKHLDVNVTFRCPVPLKERMAALAALLGANGVDASEAWRIAGQQFCDSHPERK